MKKARQRITKKLVDALQPGETIWDTDIRGFGVRRQIHDKVFILKASASSRRYYVIIGKHGSPFTVDQARNEAIQQLALLQSRTASSIAKQRICTMKEFCDRYLRDHALKYKRPTSVRSNRSLINCHILPLLGQVPVDRIDREKIEEFQNGVAIGLTAPSDPVQARKLNKGGRTATGGIGTANRAVALLSKFLNLAEDWKLRPRHSNPVHRLRRYKEKGRRRYLSSGEISRIGEAMRTLESEQGAHRPLSYQSIPLPNENRSPAHVDIRPPKMVKSQFLRARCSDLRPR